MSNEIIVVKQLPVIAEQLQTIKADVTERVSEALSLVCTEETVKTVKEARAELNKEFKYWEERRRAVKNAIIAPYEQFESVYKDCITDVFKKADAELKGKIDGVENELKEKKTAEVMAYFDEYRESKNIQMPLTFACANINVTLSASLKSLKEQAKAFIDRVSDDLALIETQEYKNEIYLEYNSACFLNVSAAITTVVNRHKAIEEAKARDEERKARMLAEKEAAAKVDEVAPPTVETIAPPTVEEKTLTVSFKVTATRSKLQELKKFLNDGGYIYE